MRKKKCINLTFLCSPEVLQLILVLYILTELPPLKCIYPFQLRSQNGIVFTHTEEEILINSPQCRFKYRATVKRKNQLAEAITSLILPLRVISKVKEQHILCLFIANDITVDSRYLESKGLTETLRDIRTSTYQS